MQIEAVHRVGGWLSPPSLDGGGPRRRILLRSSFPFPFPALLLAFLPTQARGVVKQSREIQIYLRDFSIAMILL